MAKKAFQAEWSAGEILDLYETRKGDEDEARLRRVSEVMRLLCRLEKKPNIPKVYESIAKDVRTPYIRDAWGRISASLVAKTPIIKNIAIDDKNKKFREASADASRWDMAFMERMNKDTGEDTLYKNVAGLVRDGESVMKVVHKPHAWAKFPRMNGKSGDEILEAQDVFKKTADFPIAWRNVDRLSCIFEEGEYGDEWALEYGDYATPYLKTRYGMREVDGRLVNPYDLISGKPSPEGYSYTSRAGFTTKIEFVTRHEWHVLINGIEAPGWPKPNPYAPHLNYFRAKAHESESLLYSLLFLVPRLDELLTMKLNWAFLGSYPNPVMRTLPSAVQMASLDGPMGAIEGAKVEWEPGKMIDLPPGKELVFLTPPPIGQDTNELLQILRGMIDIAGIPSVMRGDTQSGDSGYLANQMLAAASMHYKLASLTIQRQHEQAIDFVHWLVPNVIKQTVFVFGYNDINPKTNRPIEKAGQDWLALSIDKQGKNMAPVKMLGPTTMKLRPTLPTDEQARAMIAVQTTNAPKPLYPVRFALEKFMEEEDADAIMDEIWVEQAMNQPPLLDIMTKEALREAGLELPPDPAPPIDPMAAMALLGGGQIPPGPGELNPIAPGEVAGGIPSVQGINEPMVPTAPTGMLPGTGGRVAGAYPGQPPVR